MENNKIGIIQIYSGPKEEILDKGIMFGLFYLCLAFFQATVQYLQLGYFTVVANRVANRLHSKTYRNLMRQDGTFYDREANSPQRLLTRLATDVERIQPVINSKIGKLFQEICTDLVGYSMGIYYCWQIAILVRKRTETGCIFSRYPCFLWPYFALPGGHSSWPRSSKRMRRSKKSAVS